LLPYRINDFDFDARGVEQVLIVVTVVGREGRERITAGTLLHSAQGGAGCVDVQYSTATRRCNEKIETDSQWSMGSGQRRALNGISSTL